MPNDYINRYESKQNVLSDFCHFLVEFVYMPNLKVYFVDTYKVHGKRHKNDKVYGKLIVGNLAGCSRTSFENSLNITVNTSEL